MSQGNLSCSNSSAMPMRKGAGSHIVGDAPALTRSKRQVEESFRLFAANRQDIFGTAGSSVGRRTHLQQKSIFHEQRVQHPSPGQGAAKSRHPVAEQRQGARIFCVCLLSPMARIAFRLFLEPRPSSRPVSKGLRRAFFLLSGLCPGSLGQGAFQALGRHESTKGRAHATHPVCGRFSFACARLHARGSTAHLP